MYLKLFVSLLVLSFALQPILVPCHATTVQDEYEKLQQEITRHKKKLKNVKKRESSVLTDLENLNKQLKIKESDLKKYKKRLQRTSRKIAQIQDDISQNLSTVARYREWIKRKIRAMHKYGTNNDIFMLFMSTNDISHVSRNAKYLQFIASYEHGIMQTIKENIDSLNQKEKELKTLQAELQKNREKVRKQEASLAEKKLDRKVMLSSIKKEKSTHDRMIRELNEASQKLLEIIRQSEMKKEDTFTGTGFSMLRGKLPWPVRGKIAIPYGTQKDPQFNTPIFRSGIYISADSLSLAKAVYPGKVVFAEWFKGYGQLVILNHGEGYHTLYGSLAEIFTNVGDIIKENEVVGRVGNSGIMNIPGLYFELRYKGKPLDPSQWIKRR